MSCYNCGFNHSNDTGQCERCGIHLKPSTQGTSLVDGEPRFSVSRPEPNIKIQTLEGQTTSNQGQRRKTQLDPNHSNASSQSHQKPDQLSHKVIAKPSHIPPSTDQSRAQNHSAPSAPQESESGRRRTQLSSSSSQTPTTTSSHRVPSNIQRAHQPAHQPAQRGTAQRSRTRLDGASTPAPNKGALSRPNSVADPRKVIGLLLTYDFNPYGQTYTLREGKNTIGRSRDNDISLFFDDTVSDRHATIIYRNGHIAIKDEGSTSGSYVNQEDIGIGEVCKLKERDVVKIGQVRFLSILVTPQEYSKIWEEALSESKS
jgi:hypothetical protein